MPPPSPQEQLHPCRQSPRHLVDFFVKRLWVLSPAIWPASLLLFADFLRPRPQSPGFYLSSGLPELPWLPCFLSRRLPALWVGAVRPTSDRFSHS